MALSELGADFSLYLAGDEFLKLADFREAPTNSILRLLCGLLKIGLTVLTLDPESERIIVATTINPKGSTDTSISILAGSNSRAYILLQSEILKSQSQESTEQASD